MKSSLTGSPAAGIALGLSGIATVLASIIEFLPGEARGDGDNPRDSLNYLAQHPYAYSYSGLALAVGGALLIVAVVGVYRTLDRPGLAYASVSVFGALAGGFLFSAGIMRMQAVGTVPYIQSLNQSWGEAAYLAVQMAGTQGLLSAGVVCVAAWLVGLALLFARRRLWWPVAFALFPATVLLVLTLDLLFPTMAAGDSTELLFITYIGSVTFGTPLCCVAFGVTLVVPRVRQILAAPDERAGRRFRTDPLSG